MRVGVSVGVCRVFDVCDECTCTCNTLTDWVGFGDSDDVNVLSLRFSNDRVIGDSQPTSTSTDLHDSERVWREGCGSGRGTGGSRGGGRRTGWCVRWCLSTGR